MAGQGRPQAGESRGGVGAPPNIAQESPPQAGGGAMAPKCRCEGCRTVITEDQAQRVEGYAQHILCSVCAPRAVFVPHNTGDLAKELVLGDAIPIPTGGDASCIFSAAAGPLVRDAVVRQLGVRSRVWIGDVLPQHLGKYDHYKLWPVARSRLDPRTMRLWDAFAPGAASGKCSCDELLCEHLQSRSGAPRTVIGVMPDLPGEEVLALLNAGHAYYQWDLRLASPFGALPDRAGTWCTRGNGFTPVRQLHLKGDGSVVRRARPADLWCVDTWTTAGWGPCSDAAAPRGDPVIELTLMGATTRKPFSKHSQWIQGYLAGKRAWRLAWQRGGAPDQAFSIGEVMGNDWTVLRTFKLLSRLVEPGPCPNVAWPNGLGEYGTRSAKAVLDKPLDIDVTIENVVYRTYSALDDGSVMLSGDQEEHLWLPPMLVREAAKAAASRERTPDLVNQVVAELKQYATRINLPLEFQSGEIITACAVLGLTSGFRAEVGMLNAFAAYVNAPPGGLWSWLVGALFWRLPSLNEQYRQAMNGLRLERRLFTRVHLLTMALLILATLGIVALTQLEAHEVDLLEPQHLPKLVGHAGPGIWYGPKTATQGGARPLSGLEPGEVGQPLSTQRRLLWAPESSVVLIPLAEELVKRIHWVVPIVLAAIEALFLALTMYSFIRGFLWRSVVHIALACAPLPVAVSAHVAWNLVMRARDALVWGGTRVVQPGPLVLYNTCVEEEGRPRDVHVRQGARVNEAPEVKCKPRPALWLYGIGTTSAVPSVFRACTCNERAAVMGRAVGVTEWSECAEDEEANYEEEHGRHNVTAPVTPDVLEARYRTSPYYSVAQYWEEMWDNLLLVPSLFLDHFAPGVFPLPTPGCVEVRPVPFGEWAARFPSSLRLHDVKDWYDVHQRIPMRGQAFVKQENGIGHTVFGVDNSRKDPRLIQGRSGPVKVTTGPETLGIHKAFREALQGEDAPVVYGPGMTAEDLGRWFTRSLAFLTSKLHVGSKLVIIEDDAARWDMRVHPSALCFTAFIYGFMLPLCTMFLDVVRARGGKEGKRWGFSGLRRTAKTRNGISLQVEGTVQSGDGDTTCGNTLLHYCIVVRLMLHIYGVLKRAADYPLRSVVMGDDGVVMAVVPSGCDVAKCVVDNGKYAGHKVEVTVRDAYDVEFCSGRFYPVGLGHMFGPKPGRVLAKTFYSRVPYRGWKASAWVRGVCLGLESGCEFIPVLRTLIARMLELTEGRAPLFDSQAERFVSSDGSLRGRLMPGSRLQPTAETYCMMAHVYGLTKDELDECERWISSNVRTIPVRVRHPVLDRFIARDT